MATRGLEWIPCFLTGYKGLTSRVLKRLVVFCCGYKIPGFLGSSHDFKVASRGLELLPVFWNGFQSLKVDTKDFDWHLRFCSGFLSGY